MSAGWQQRNDLINGSQVHSRWRRHPSAQADRRPALVFLHEALGSTSMWKDVPERLADLCGCHALVYDRLGHGTSDPLPAELARGDYHYREAWDYLPQLLTAAGLKRVVLVGHSDGGTIALLAAARLAQVSAVVAEAAHVLVEECTRQGIRETISAPDVEQMKARIGRYHCQDIEPIFRRWPDVWLDDSFAEWSMEQHLADIECPLLVIQGDQDQFGSLRQVEAIVAGVRGSVESLVLPDCGHVPHFEAGELYLQQVADFLSRRGLADGN